jgi:hypothetical protein
MNSDCAARVDSDPCGSFVQASAASKPRQEQVMIDRRSFYGAVSDPGLLADRRAQFESEQQERVAERQQQIALLSSPMMSADERIQLWERLYALALQRSPKHKLL